MISTSWGAPAAFTQGFNLQHVSDGLYGRHLHIYSWPEGELKQTIDLGPSGLLPLEVSFENFIKFLKEVQEMCLEVCSKCSFCLSFCTLLKHKFLSLHMMF